MANAQLTHVDAFADAPFGGNPAMVCQLPDAREIDAAWMQGLAADVNLSETVFLRPLADEADFEFEIRWFTPRREVDLCGHATLASGHVLYESGQVEAGDAIRLRSNSGQLTLNRGGDLLWMDFPSVPADREPDPAEREAILSALRLDSAEFVGCNAQEDSLVAVAERADVERLAPDFRVLAAIPGKRGFMVTASTPDEDGPDFVSRYFAPVCGVDEDPVTGSAHCGLAPFWGERLGKGELVAHQISERGGTVHCRLDGERVHIGGRAVTIYSGSIELPT